MSVAGCVLLVIFGLIAFLGGSRPFASGHRFIIPVVALWLSASLVATVGLSQALRGKPSGQRRLLWVILGVAIGARGIAAFTPPILEVDFYRYLWDGKVLAHGVSPYAYSPAQVLAGETGNDDSDYQRAVSCSLESETNHTILHRVHFADFTTVYPPVSQFVFAATMKWFPANASVTAHILWIKFVLVLFDLATMAVLIKMLILHRRSVGWLIGYAWNPLVIKEIANSAHLDSIAVFFTVTSVYLATLFFTRFRPMGLPKIPCRIALRERSFLARSKSSVFLCPLLCGLCLGLGFGAKLFPIVLAPLLVIGFAKVRWTAACSFLVGLAIVVIACLSVHHRAMDHRSDAQQYFNQRSTDHASSEGLESFLSTWRMNDVVFSGIYRNLKPVPEHHGVPWYVITSNDARERIVNWWRQNSWGGDDPAFFLTRLITMTVFLVFYAWLLVKTGASTQPIEIATFAWVTAVFLFLQPTVNPWYWVWVAPLACFSNCKGLLLVSGLLSIYYLRFWFENLPNFDSLAGTVYRGAGLFDHGVAWLEFAAILAVMFFSASRSRRLKLVRSP